MFTFYRNTKSRVDHEQEADLMEKMEEQAELIDYDEFAANVDFAEVAEQLGYDDDLPLKDDWHVTYSKSKYGGLPCYILGHSECDFIFLQSKDAKMLQESFAKGMTDLEWKRHTQYGKSGLDPR